MKKYVWMYVSMDANKLSSVLCIYDVIWIFKNPSLTFSMWNIGKIAILETSSYIVFDIVETILFWQDAQKVDIFSLLLIYNISIFEEILKMNNKNHNKSLQTSNWLFY